ncbi:TetR/AcrR family transcriptional regulator [Thermanaerovibrio velox]|uniref:TetR/AcrR family transcriptional regulator n=1 Tax=Thermanaerovibrio velox TaxID=108007 RepID=UPI00247A9AAF|nr:TetR/AcrR family transcriptional regulator [Thermanaerovibrio velox]
MTDRSVFENILAGFWKEGVYLVSDAKDAIMSSARIIFAQRGYEGAGVDSIVRSAGVSKGAFYWHFHSKFDLFKRVMEDEVDRIVSYLADGSAQGEDVIAMSVRKGEGFLQLLWKERDSLSLWLELRLLAHRGVEGMRDLTGSLRSRMMGEMRRVLAEAGGLPDGMEEVLCILFDGIMFNLWVWFDVEDAVALWRRSCGVLFGGEAL